MTPDDTLFIVDNTPYSREDCERAVAALATHPPLAQPSGLRLAVCLSDCFQWLALCLHLRNHGGSVLPIHPGTPPAAARDLAASTGCHYLLHGDGAALETCHPTTSAGDATPGGGELIQLSSGTTGHPKAIARRWTDIDQELDSYVRQFTDADGLTPIVACPVTHSYGLICGVLAGLRRGVVPRIVTNLNPRFILGVLRESPAHLLYASPTLVALLVRMLPPEQAFHTVMLSGATLPAPLLDTLNQRSQRVCQQYGCSEAGCIALTTQVQHAGLLGEVLPHLTVTAGAGADAPEEIRVTVHRENGEPDLPVHTRDLGYLDTQGQLNFLARMDDTINVAGINVYPGDVENVFLRHPDITDAVAYKQPDPYAGERVCLRFVANHELDTEALRHWCRDQLSPHQVPVILEQVEQIARLANGKIRRRLLAPQTESQPESQLRTEVVS